MRSKLLFLGLALILLLLAFHAFSNHYYIYWTNGWTDHVTHMVGTTALGVIGLWLCFSSGLFPRKIPSSREAVMLCFSIALVVGIVWEAFEYGSGIVVWSSKYPMDTLGDLVSDVAGGLVAGVIGIRKTLYE